jgi:hypothetical protein
MRKQLWPIEAVYALVEVKTNLSITDLQDAVAKGRAFKKLARSPIKVKDRKQSIDESLFVIWAFDAPSTET